MDQYPELQNVIRHESFLDDCQLEETQLKESISTIDPSSCLQNNIQLIDEELFQVDYLATRHSLFHDSEMLAPQRTRKNSTNSMDESCVLTDFKSYIQKFTCQPLSFPSSSKVESVRRKRIVKRTGRTSFMRGSTMRQDKSSTIVIRRSTRKPHCHDSFEFSVDESTEQKSHALLNESERMWFKASKVSKFWKHSSLMIPNVFRITSQLPDSRLYMLEYQDLSRKEVLATQNGGFKASRESSRKSENLPKAIS